MPTEQAGRIARGGGHLPFGWTGVTSSSSSAASSSAASFFDEIRDTRRFDSRRFLVRRAFKIWPLYSPCWPTSSSSPRSSVARLPAGGGPAPVPNVFHVQNYFDTLRAHTWSLAVEEHFYLLLPLVLLALTRLRRPPDRRPPAPRGRA